MKTRKLTVMALTTALAMILSFVESQIPAFVAVPGVKMGLANIAVVFALYKLGWKEAVGVSLIRVVLVSILFGTVASLFYSLAGAVLSLLGMGLLKKTGRFTEIVVSVAGGMHPAGDGCAEILSPVPAGERHSRRRRDRRGFGNPGPPDQPENVNTAAEQKKAIGTADGFFVLQL